MTDKDGHHHFFWGLLLVTVGATWTARNLGYVNDDLWQFWPMVFVAAGLWKLLHQAVHHD